jgi:hypothetical protein
MATNNVPYWPQRLAVVTATLLVALAWRPAPAAADPPPGSCDSSAPGSKCCSCRIEEVPPSDYLITECEQRDGPGFGNCQDGSRETGGFCHGSCQGGS